MPQHPHLFLEAFRRIQTVVRFVNSSIETGLDGRPERILHLQHAIVSVPCRRAPVKFSRTAENAQYEQIKTAVCPDPASGPAKFAGEDFPLSARQTNNFAPASFRHFCKMALCLLKRVRLAIRQKSKN
jgi:hypothetical protein